MSTSNISNDTRRYAIYARKSKFTGRGESINHQIEKCRNYLIQSGVDQDDIIIFEDEGYSGGTTDRPQFQDMMKQCDNDLIQCVICYKLDRISRSVLDFADTFNDLKDHNVRFISVNDHITGNNSPMDMAMMQIIAVFAELERNIIAERITDNMTMLAKAGRWLGGTTPTGYTSVETIGSTTAEGKIHVARKLELVPEQVDLVQKIYSLYLKTESLTAIQAKLINDDIKTKMDNEYTRFAIKNILRNPVYAKADEFVLKFFKNKGATIYAAEDKFDGTHGMMVYNKTEQKKNVSHKTKPYKEWIVSLGEHKGIIDGADWVRVQEILDNNKDKNYNRPRSHCALLSGLLFCGNCRSIMYPRVAKTYNERGERVFSYACKRKLESKRGKCDMKRINGNFLDDLVWEQVKDLSSDTSELMIQLKNVQGNFISNEQPIQEELEQLQKRLKENEKKQTNLANYIATNGSDLTSTLIKQINDQSKELEDSSKKINDEIQKLIDIIEKREIQSESFTDLITRLSNFSAALDTQTTFEDKRFAIRQIIRRVEWDGENVTIYFFGDRNIELQEVKDELIEYKRSHRNNTRSEAENTTLSNDSKRDPNALPFSEKVCQRYSL